MYTCLFSEGHNFAILLINSVTRISENNIYLYYDTKILRYQLGHIIKIKDQALRLLICTNGLLFEPTFSNFYIEDV